MVTIDDFTTWVGLDAAIIGYAYNINTEPVLVYDYEKMKQIFMDQGMESEEADEWIQFNIVGAFIGDNTPLTLEKLFYEEQEAETEG